MVWDFAGKGPAGSTARMLRAHETVTGLSWHPGAGGLLASCGREGTVAVWRPGRGLPGKVQRPLTTHTLDSAATSVRWAAPGTLIATAKDGTVIRMDGLA